MAEPLRDIGPLRPLLLHAPLGVVSDIDGTLSPVVSEPDEARVTDTNLQLLERLVAGGARVALVTGRALDKARSMAPIDGVAFAANHGLELWVEGGREPAPGVEEYARRALLAVEEMSEVGIDQVVVENKGPVLAFHYRNARDAQGAREAILWAIRSSQQAAVFRVTEGRMLIELRPPLPIDKGTALRELARRLGMRALICLGDDATDADMFRAVRELRDEGVPGACLAVRSDEMAPEVAQAADYLVDGVEGVEWLLGELVSALEDGA